MGGKTIHSRERALILKVLAFFEKEKEAKKFLIPVDPTKGAEKAREHEQINKKILIPVDQPVNRTCAATGVSRSTILRIKKQVKLMSSSSTAPSTSNPIPRPPTPGKKRMQSKKKIFLDNFDLVALRNLVNSFYTARNEVPTLNKILAAAKKDLNFPGEKTTLRHILNNQLGYKFKKCKNTRLFLLPKPDIAACRARYLRRINENNDLGEDKKPVTYLDKTLISSHYTGRKSWQNRSHANVNNTNPEQRWMLVHAGGENGFIPGVALLYECKNKPGNDSDEIDVNNFFEWLNEKLIPNLPPNGIVVIDNAPFHSTLTEKIPTQTSVRSDMESWLIKHNVSFDENMTKAELYQLIRFNKPEKKYIVDELLKDHGHEVLRLPPYHCDLNPVAYIWNLLKQRVAEKITNEAETQIELIIIEAIRTITIAEWKKKVSHVQRLEKEYWVKDRLQETRERDLIMTFGGEESSASETERDESDSDVDDNDSAMSGIEESSDE